MFRSVIGNSIFAGERLVFEVEKNPFWAHSRNALAYLTDFYGCSRGWVRRPVAFPKLIQIPKSKQVHFPN